MRTTLGGGGFVGSGPRPAEVNPADLVDPNTGLPLPERQLVRQLGIQSEFGTYPGLLFAELKAYW